MTSKKLFKNKILANFSFFILCVLCFICTFTTNESHAFENAPVVVELFTSKYCPACPAADENFNQLIKNNPAVIGLSCHVTYFNGASRRDKLSKPLCNARQNVYKLALGTGGVFTPMAVTQGQDFITGMKAGELSARAKAYIHATDHAVSLEQNGRYLEISLPSIALSQKADVWLIEVQKRANQSGYSHYRNTVTNMQKLLSWNGKPVNMAFPVTITDNNTGYAILVQTYKDGVLAAGKTGF